MIRPRRNASIVAHGETIPRRARRVPRRPDSAQKRAHAPRNVVRATQGGVSDARRHHARGCAARADAPGIASRPSIAARLRARRDLRGARRHRSRRSRRPARRDRRPAVRGRVPRADRGRRAAASRSADSLRAITTKLVRRHPHVFGTTPSSVDTPGKVVEQWEQIKAQRAADAGERAIAAEGVPKAAAGAAPRARDRHAGGGGRLRLGGDPTDVVDKIEEEVAELREAMRRTKGRERVEEEMGDLLFAIANLSRKLGVEPESALRKANEKFSARFQKRWKANSKRRADRPRRDAGRDGRGVARDEGLRGPLTADGDSPWSHSRRRRSVEAGRASS